MKMSVPGVCSLGYFAVRPKVSVLRPAMCIDCQGVLQMNCFARVTNSKSEAGSDLANRVRQMKSSKCVVRNEESLTLFRHRSVCRVSAAELSLRSRASMSASKKVT